MSEAGTCRGCNAPIYWVVTAAGKRAPLDRAVTVVIDDAGASHAGHLSHFVTCPARDQFRKAR
jgi:hypothetical protein